MTVDWSTALLRLLTGALGGKHPIRLVLGVSSSLLAKGAVSLSAHTYPDLDLLSFMNVESWYFMIVIIPLWYAPLIMRGRGAPESAVHQATTLRMLMEEGKLSQAEQRMCWRMLIDKYLKAVTPDLSLSPDLQKLLRESQQELEE